MNSSTIVQAQTLAAASSRLAEEGAADADEARENDGGDGDVPKETGSKGALGLEDDDEVVYTKTTRYGVEIME